MTTEYLRHLGLSQDERGRASLERALDRAHEIRQFEIDLYWKRSNYFWLLQAAVLAGFGLTFRANSTLDPIIPVGLSCLGFLCALASYFSARGSKFWQENWEAHIDFLEGGIEGALHRSAWMDRPSWSVSRVNETLLLSFVVFWGGLFFISNMPIFKSIPAGADCDTFIRHGIGSFLALLVSAGLAVRMASQESQHLNASVETGFFHPNGKQLRVRKTLP